MTVAGGSSGTHLPADYVPTRVAAVPAGSRGDVTCLRTEQFSKCVGQNEAVDWDRLAEIKAQLPEMFVVCRNQYDPAVDDQFKSAFYAPWIEVRDQDPDAISDLTKNPCVDFVFNADRLSVDARLDQARSLKKIGDSRYSSVYWVPEAQIASPLGYGPSAADPETGEIFWGVANIYGAPLYTYAAMTRDLFDLVNGHLDTEDFVTGERIREYLLQSGGTASSTSALTEPPMSMPEGSTPPAVQTTEVPPPAGLNRDAWKDRRFLAREVMEAMRDKEIGQQMINALPVAGTSFGETRLSAFANTPIEDLLTNREMAMADEKPLQWANLGELLAKERERRHLLSRNNYCYADFDDTAILGMARSWGCMPGDERPVCDADFDPLAPTGDHGSPCCIRDGNQLASAIAQRYYTAVVEHEVGHTLGLRHNFEGSSDLFNYQDRYFDLREKDLNPCTTDDECDVIFGEFCNEGVCYRAQNQECSTVDDCVYGKNAGGQTIKAVPKSTDAYDCVAGRCVELKRCGLHGECDGGTCDVTTWTCFEDGVRVETPVAAGGPVRKFLPRAHLTETEAALGRTHYQYSSIMDYGQRWNSDIVDIGKYDRAAIRFGYGRLLDVYQDLGDLWQNLHTFAEMYGIADVQNSDTLDSSYWGWGVYFSQFYFLQDFIGVEANRSEGAYARNRAAVPFEWVTNQQNAALNFYRQYLDWAYVVVPYKFCGDDYEGNVGCYTWDTGVDVLEMVHNMGVAMKEYYLVDAFKRERYGFGLAGNPMSYLSRVLTRYMDRMRGAGMYYALFAHIFKNYDWRGYWANTHLMGWGLRRASETGFELLANAITSPAPGSYVLDADTNTYRNVDYTPGVQGSELDVSLGSGKYPFTTFMDDAGYFYWNHALWIGSFWEKLAAIMTLTDSTVYFTTDFVGEQLDIGVGTSIGFNTLYQRQLTELFGGQVAGDQERGAWVVQDGAAQPRRYFEPENPDGVNDENALLTPYLYEASTPLLEPSIDNLTMDLYLMLYGMAYIPASFDPSFLDSFSICIKGSGNCYDIGESAETTAREFTDPFAGKTYLVWAPSYQDHWYSPNVALVDRANLLKAQWASTTGDERLTAETALRQAIEVLDQMRTVYEVMSSMRI